MNSPVHERVGGGDSPGSGALATCPPTEGGAVPDRIAGLTRLQCRRALEMLSVIDRPGAKVWITPGGQIRCNKSDKAVPFRADTPVRELEQRGWVRPVHDVYQLTDAGRAALAELTAQAQQANPVTVRHV